VNLDELLGAFSFEEGFSRPNWRVIAAKIGTLPERDSRRLAWDAAVLQWIANLVRELGGDYRMLRAGRCVLLSNLEDAPAKRLLRFTQSAIDQIAEYLSCVARKGFEGLHVVLLFAEEDDYYQYLSGFYSEGFHPSTAGVHIHRGYPHVACFHHAETSTARVISHELVHHSIHHLSVPLWLHEGLAISIERLMGSQRVQMLSDDLPERHHKFWDAKSIQRFWAGTAFDEPGESVELSYSLAEVLFHLLAKNRQDFLAFIEAADYADAGQTAALECLGTCLGDAIGTFLGPGNWRPQRKAIKECWGRETKET
jgi:hypothetical protein